MEPQSIFSIIRQECKDFYDNSISVVPGYSFNQYKTLKRAYLYLNSKYENGGSYLGRDLLFYNIVLPPCEVATRMLNVDTKNIRLWPTNPKSYYSTFLLEKELKQWLKTSKMGKILNQIAEEAPRYGSVVLEKTKTGAQVVDLRRLVLDPTVDTITDSRFVTTVHYMTPTQLRETGWDNVEEAIKLFGNTNAMDSFEDDFGNVTEMKSTPYIKVHKRHGEVPEWMLGKGKSEKMVRALFIVAGAESEFKNAEGQSTGDAGKILFKSQYHKAWPFKDFHYTKVKGRYLGLGITEMLFDTQVRLNELKNQKRISMELSSMHLFQTPDQTIMRNALTDLQSGDIIQSKNGITPILNEERNLSAFESEEQSFREHAMSLSFANEAVNGTSLAASTPATNALIAQQGSTSVYAFKRENLTLFLQDFFNELVVPQMMKDLNKEHIMRFVGNAQELAKIDEAAADVCASDYIKEKLLKGQITTPEELDSYKQSKIAEFKRHGEQRFLKIMDAFYDDVEFEFDFLIGNELEDATTLTANRQAALGSYNPQAMQDPLYKLLYTKYLQTIGISQAEIELADQQTSQMQQQQMQQAQMMPQLPAPKQTTNVQ